MSTPTPEQIIQEYSEIIKEALHGAAAHRYSTAISYQFDADRCEKSGDEVIRNRAEGIRARVADYQAQGDKFKAVLNAISALPMIEKPTA